MSDEVLDDCRSARISECGRYRYTLTRETGERAGSVLWVMLNPSTADATEDDPTIRKCVGFTKRWGFRHLKVVSLFAWRATDPKMLEVDDDKIIDSENIRAVFKEVSAHDRVVFAWGGGLKYAHGNKWVAEFVARTFLDAQCLGVNKDGTPKHPLYLSYETELVPYTYAQSQRIEAKAAERTPL